MKNNIINALAAVALLSFAACDDYDDKFDGLDNISAVSDVKTLAITLTGEDYAAIAENAINQSIAQAKGVADELARLEDDMCFTSTISASEYLPAFIREQYPTADIGSAVVVSYEQENVPDYIDELSTAGTYTLTADDYETVWSSKGIVAQFLTPATESRLPAILKSAVADAADGDILLVNYNYQATEPSTGTTSGEASGAGYYPVTAFEGEGKYLFVYTDGSSYMAAEPLSKNYGYLYTQDVALSGDMIIADETAEACAFEVKAIDGSTDEYSIMQVSDSRYIYQTGTYNSFNATATLGTDGFAWTFTTVGSDIHITNVAMQKWIQYSVNYTSYGCYNYEAGVCPQLYIYRDAAAAKSTGATKAATVNYNAAAVMQFNGSAWEEYTVDDAEVAALDPSVYNSLGSAYVSDPDAVLPVYLGNSYPFAAAEDVLAVVYMSSSVGVSADEYVFDGVEWVPNGTVGQSDQFVKNSTGWVWNPSVTVDLTPGRGDAFTSAFYQLCTDWVWANVDQAQLGVSTLGGGYVTSYGNNDYYSGASAYYGNVDWRASAARNQYGAEYGSMTDEEVQALMQERLIEVFAHALAAQYPDADVIEGVDVFYTINFIVYTGGNANYTIQYIVTGKGQFGYVPDSLAPME